MSATAGYSWPSRTTLRVVFGTVVDGALVAAGRRYEVSPGILAAVGVARQWLRGRWFVTATGTFATSRSSTASDEDTRVALTAVDFRGGVMAGRIVGPVSVYGLARGFGGPVFWTLDEESITGTDRYKFQLGAGITMTTARGVSVVVDASLVGERALSTGVSLPL